MAETQRPIQKKLEEETFDGIALPKKIVQSYTFKVPKSCRDENRDPVSFSMRELSPDEISTARKLTDEYAALKMALHAVDGHLVDHAVEEGSRYWGKFSPKVRTLVGVAFKSIHSTTDDEDNDFLSSMVPD